MKKLKTYASFTSRMLMYRFFKAFPKWEAFNTKKTKDFTKIISEFHRDLTDIVCEERAGVELPLKMGEMKIVSYRTNRQYPNWGVKQGESVLQHYNHHTDGLKCRIFYSNHNPRYKFKDKICWEFKSEFFFRRKVSVAFSADHNRYIRNEDKMIAYRNKVAFDMREQKEARIKKFMETYNEFELV